MAAIAYRAGDDWTVVLLEGSAATFGKRGAQIGLIVVDEKKLDWDEPVTKVYPDSKLADKQIEIKNLICACTGMPRQHVEWLFDNSNIRG